MKAINFAYPTPLIFVDEIFQPSLESLDNIAPENAPEHIITMTEQITLDDKPILSKVLNTEGFPVFLATFPTRKDQLAIKIFPYIAYNPDPCFLNEIKFIKLRHNLDLKPANLLLSEDYILKVANFDQAYHRGQGKIYSQGTESFRAAEIIKSTCKNPEAADIYSAGIILFILKCSGTLPYLEKGKYYGCDLQKIFINDSCLFWETHCKIQDCISLFFDEDFKELFSAMVAIWPEKRPTIKQIKASRWYNGPIYSQEEVRTVMKDVKN